jgi:hypothetical protein
MKFGSRDLLFPIPQVRRLNPRCHPEDERRDWAGHGHTQRWCSHTYDDYAAGGVGPDHGELFRHHELRNQFGFADSGRAMTLGEATEAALAKGPVASV